MKILRIINSTSPKHGGPIEGIKQISAVLAAQGHETEVVCLDAPDDPWIEHFPLVVHPLGPASRRYRHSPAFIPWLSRNADRFDLVFVHGIWQFVSYGAWKTLKSLGKPYFLYTHGSLDPWTKQDPPIKRLEKMVYWKWRENRVLRDAKAVLFTCEQERLLARQSFQPYQCTEMVVSYGTARPAGEPDAQRDAFLSKFPELRGKRLLLFVGRIHPKKGCDLILGAFAQTTGNEERLHLVIAGPDEIGWQSELQALAVKLGIASRVTWVGMLTGDLKWGAFRAAEAFILPSHGENFGIAVAEALACGVPVLISSKVNIWHEIQADGAGFVADDTVEGASELLQRWLALPAEEQQAMRFQAEETFRNRFDYGNSAPNLIKTLMAVQEARVPETAI